MSGSGDWDGPISTHHQRRYAIIQHHGRYQSKTFLFSDLQRTIRDSTRTKTFLFVLLEICSDDIFVLVAIYITAVCKTSNMLSRRKFSGLWIFRCFFSLFSEENRRVNKRGVVHGVMHMGVLCCTASTYLPCVPYVPFIC